MKTLTTTRRVYGNESPDDTAGTMWRPTDFDDFNDGGAYPEVFAVQFPSEIGWQKKEINSEINDTISCPPSLPVDMETLMKDSTETMLRVKGNRNRTDAHEKIETFGSLCEAKSIEIIDNDTVDAKMFENEFVTCENGVGKPCVVRNIFKDRFHGVDLLDLFPEEMLTVNDKAPARRTDKGAMRQNTLLVTSKRYKEYMDDYEKCNEDDDDAKPAPFYNIGWRIFSTHPEKVNPEIVIRATHMQSHVDAMTANVSRSLNKAFIGPAGCITRLHYDAQNAHGFLAQTKGRKLFVLFHPAADVGATNCCSSADEQTEMNQSLIDPLRHIPEKARKAPLRWWHYAVSLDSSQTVMRNFFHSKTNVEGLVTMVMRSVANNQTN
ncbi:unnamed protein product [Bathycoccus prasinos]